MPRICDKLKVPEPNVLNESPLVIVMRGGDVDGMKIRKTNETPPRVSIYDLINVVCDTDRGRNIFYEMKEKYPDICIKQSKETVGNHSASCFSGEEMSEYFQFPGERQRPTPVADARGVVMIINLLSGPKAAMFRLQSADVIVRYLGGDKSLIEEIKRNADLQEVLPTDAPIAIFGQDVKARTIIAADKLLSVEGIKDLGVPSGVRSPNCVYCILIGHDPDLNKLVFKFGLAENFNTRMSDHRKTYMHSIVVFVVSLGEYAVKPVEDTIKYFEKVKNRIVYVTTKDSTGREYFACTRKDMESVILGILEEVKNHHGDKIDNVYYKSQNLLTSDEFENSKDLEIEKEKTKQAEEVTKQIMKQAEVAIKQSEEATKQAEQVTKQAEAAVKKAEIELEMMKLKLQYV